MTALPDPQTLCRRIAATLHAALAPLAAGRPRYGLLDYPSHWNIGDSAIWAGEAVLLRRLHGRGPDHVSHVRYAPDRPGRHLPEDRLIYLHGGGNFGDVWPAYQTYREAVLAHHPRHRIVQLPQSIHYRDPAAIERSKRAIGAHRDFHLMVRDHESHAFATRHFDCPVILAPDSAFCLVADHRPAPATAPRGVVALLRDDHEQRPDAAAGRAALLAAGAVAEDWNRHSALRRKAEKLVLGGAMVAPGAPLARLWAQMFDRMAMARVTLGLTQIDRAEIVVTDRLHGHILSSLLGKPHVVIDNFYGKTSRFIAAWGQDDRTHVARDYAEARALLDQMPRG